MSTGPTSGDSPSGAHVAGAGPDGRTHRPHEHEVDAERHRAVPDGHRDEPVDADRTRGEHVAPLAPQAVEMDRQSVLAREREHFGGMKVGSAFFGWLTAAGTAVILSALAVGFGATAGQGADEETLGLVGAITLLVVIFVSYFAGGYVAGRMARFDGAKQGLAVWLWALVMAIAVAVLGLLAGSRFDDLGAAVAFPRIDLGADATTTGILVALVVAVTGLVGAVLGGVTGMRYHRRVDRVGLGA